jgi:hypothetical protein
MKNSSRSDSVERGVLARLCFNTSLSCARCVGVLDLLLYVSFKPPFSIPAQFTLPLDFLKELQNFRS